MKRIMNVLKYGTLSLGLMVPQQALAHAGHTHDEIGAGIGIALLIIFGLIVAFAILSLIFWIMMLVHATSHDIPDKNTWIIVLVITFVMGAGLIGAIVYYFAVKREFDAKAKVAASKKQPAKK